MNNIHEEYPVTDSRLLPFLDNVMKRIEHPENWCQIQSARNSAGRDIHSCSPRAHQWCLAGSIEREYFGDGSYGSESDIPGKEVRNLIRLLNDVFGEDFSEYNDSHLHSQVMSKLRTSREVLVCTLDWHNFTVHGWPELTDEMKKRIGLDIL